MIKVDDIWKQTVIYLNEYAPEMEEATFSDEAFGAEAKADILAHIDAAARMVAQIAPANMQVAKTLKADSTPAFTLTLAQRPDGRNHATAELPSDYMRLVYLLADGLYRPITALLPSTHPTYAMQYCPIPGLGAGAYAPIGYQVDGTIDVHSFDSENENDNQNDNQNENENQVGATICYLALPKIEDVTSGGTTYKAYTTLKEELRDVIAMQAAALYLGMQESAKAQQAQQIATGMLTGLIEEADK